MLELEDLVERPMHVVCHVRNLPLYSLSAAYVRIPPAPPPASSTVNRGPHAGHVTAAWLGALLADSPIQVLEEREVTGEHVLDDPGGPRRRGRGARLHATRAARSGTPRSLVLADRERDDLVLGQTHHAFAMDRAARA